MNNPKDNPTTGEWTADKLIQLFEYHALIDEFFDYVANDHNAAIAAERELLGQQIEATTAARLRASEAEQQLAAEREKVAPPVDNKYVAEGCAQFGEVPAKTEAVFIMNRSLMLEIQQLQQQLDAAVEALKAYEYDSNGTIVVCLTEHARDAALAKIQK
jgi:hypothetical protein